MQGLSLTQRKAVDLRDLLVPVPPSSGGTGTWTTMTGSLKWVLEM